MSRIITDITKYAVHLKGMPRESRVETIQ